MRARLIGLVGLGLASLASPSWAQDPPLPPPAPGGVQYSAPPAVDPAAAQPQGALTPAETRELLDSAQATAKATREAVDYTRVMPDILTQILAKLDKIEDKLDKVENAVKAGPTPPKRR